MHLVVRPRGPFRAATVAPCAVGPGAARRVPAAPKSLAALGALAFVAATLACTKTAEEEFLAHVKPVEEIEEHGANGDGGESGEKWDLHQFLHPLEQPTWVAGNAAPNMLPTDAVVGYSSGDHTWAIPWWILKNHHVANLELDGKSISIVLCERCSSASAWDPVVDGRRLHFKVNDLYNGTIIIIDEETKTWWTPFLGEAMSGPLKGRKLSRLRLDQAAWADWLELHPDTLVADGDPAQRKGHCEREAPGEKWMGPTMKRSILHKDERLPMNDLVLGVIVGDEARAYPMKALDVDGSVLEDRVGGTDLVVLHKPGTYLAAAFARELDGEKLSFTKDSDGAAIDAKTKSRFNAAGVAKSGPLAGKKLVPVQYVMEEWYIWATQHPQSAIHGAAAQ